MIRIFEEKLGMTFRTTLHTTQIDELRNLPGWAASSESSSVSSSSSSSIPSTSATTTTTTCKPQSILQALDIEHMITSEAKAKSWETVLDEDEMINILQSMMNGKEDEEQEGGGSGLLYFPGFFEVISMNKLRDSLRNGRVWKTTTLCKANNPAIQSTTTTATTNTTTTAMFALTQDPRIDSLQSNWILSIITTTEIDLQSAVWFVCCNSSELLLQQRCNAGR